MDLQKVLNKKNLLENLLAKLSRDFNTNMSFVNRKGVTFVKIDETETNLDTFKAQLKENIQSIYKQEKFNSYHNNRVFVKNKLMLEACNRHLEKNIKDSGDLQIMSESKSIIKMILENVGIEKAEVLLASKNIVDELQKMVEKLSALQNEDLPPIVEKIKEEYGMQEAEAFNAVVDTQLRTALDTLKGVTDQTNNAVLVLSGEVMPSDMENVDMDLPVEPGLDDLDTEEMPDMEDDGFGGLDANEGPEEEPLGRARKESKENKGKVLKESKFDRTVDTIISHVRKTMRNNPSKDPIDVANSVMDKNKDNIERFYNFDVVKREVLSELGSIYEGYYKKSKSKKKIVTKETGPARTLLKKNVKSDFKPKRFKFIFKDGSVEDRQFGTVEKQAKQEAMLSVRRHNKANPDNPIVKVRPISESKVNEFLDPNMRRLQNQLKQKSKAKDMAAKRLQGNPRQAINTQVKDSEIEDLVRQVEAGGGIWNHEKQEIEIVESGREDLKGRDTSKKFSKGQKVKYKGKLVSVEVPDGPGNLVGIKKSKSDDIEMVKYSQLSEAKTPTFIVVMKNADGKGEHKVKVAAWSEAEAKKKVKTSKKHKDHEIVRIERLHYGNPAGVVDLEEKKK